ncbi:hypothetical protein [Phormidium sp. FACHB-1136]|uniref:hypothetical protein n=1 Tax=Phormidium sp. FACHB-1136 TaxID=2692848 RepID=UPI00168981FE|nr:hypothetical protein [Phormidium sp. FACHB-1136]MBD2424775.1 hypothetical protein [Phormidium sp. FACHB-1136]
MHKSLINGAIYVLATLAANYTATWFIPLPIFGQVAVGTSDSAALSEGTDQSL